MLTSRRLIATVVGALVVATVPQLTPAAADPPTDPPDCMLVICPTDPPLRVPPPDDPDDGTPGDPLDNACADLSIPVEAKDIDGDPPTGIPGAWSYQFCGEPEDINNGSAPTHGDAGTLREWCSQPRHPDPDPQTGLQPMRSCSVVVYWKPKDKDPRVPLPIKPAPHGFGRFFHLSPIAASLPPDGKVITNFPTWFYDANHLQVTGVPIPPVPLGNFGGGTAIAVHLRSWWVVDGKEICNGAGGAPDGANREQAAGVQGIDCHETFFVSGPHTAVAHSQWLIIIILAFPPYVVVFPWEFEDNLDGLTSREVQADTQ